MADVKVDTVAEEKTPAKPPAAKPKAEAQALPPAEPLIPVAQLAADAGLKPWHAAALFRYAGWAC